MANVPCIDQVAPPPSVQFKYAARVLALLVSQQEANTQKNCMYGVLHTVLLQWTVHNYTYTIMLQVPVQWPMSHVNLSDIMESQLKELISSEALHAYTSRWISYEFLLPG